MASHEWSAVVLSAGASQRWGYRPKALLPIGEETAVGRVCRLAEAAGARRIGVVVGRHADEIRPLLPSGTEAVPNPEWEQGRTGSVQAGLRWAAGSGGVLLWPVDHPFVHGSSAAAVLERARGGGLAVWVVPTYHGQGGHPVGIGRAAFPAIFALRPDEPLRNVPATLGAQVARIETNDPGVVDGSDTPEEFADGLRRWQANEA